MSSVTDKASTKVLTSFDLVEDIILYLPIREVLLTKRVCKAWENVHDESIRVKKALFLIPATEDRIYYPDCDQPKWYLTPDRNEILKAGLAPVFIEENDDDITPTNSPKRRWLELQTTKTVTQVDSAASGVANNGKPKFSFTTTIEDDGEDGKVSVGLKLRLVDEVGGQAAGGKQEGQQQAGQQADGKATTIHDLEFNESTTAKVTELGDLTSKLDISDEEVNAEIALPTEIPVNLDGKMMVSRVTPPFINPFCELFVDHYFHGSRGRYFVIGPVPIPGRGMTYSDDIVIRPQPKLIDGSTRGSTPKRRAVQRYEASWRKMHPFSAVTASVEIECFSSGALKVRSDWAYAMLSGEMMERLGEHWGEFCPDCCIVDYWFSEFIKDVSHTDNSHWNRGQHGVRKLGLNNTGWEVLEKLRANKVQATGEQDRIRPFISAV